MTSQSLTDLDRRMRALARHDRQARLFGASMHGWRTFPIPPEELAEIQAKYGLTTPPEAWRWWVSEGPGAGAGPFYGLQHPLDLEPQDGELAHALPLTDQGCGYTDWLRTDPGHAGEVWIDLRAGEGPLVLWYPSFLAWLDAWLRRGYAEWGVEYLEEAPPEAEPGFLDAVREALTWALSGPADPMLAQYPLPLDKAQAALAALHLLAGDEAAALAAFDEAAARSNEPDARRALARCRIADHKRDAAALLAAADEGLKATPRWWISEGRLLSYRARALEGLERWADGLAAREAVADHYRNDVRKNLDVVWIRSLRREYPRAAARVRDLATRGVGCDPQAPLADKLAQVSGGLLEALRREGFADRADALEAALREGDPS